MQNLYTIFVEFGGGTYISQTIGISALDALSSWAAGTKASGDGPGPRMRAHIKNQLDTQDRPVSVRGCSNVWCFSGTYNRKLVLIHIISTCSTTQA